MTIINHYPKYPSPLKYTFSRTCLHKIPLYPRTPQCPLQKDAFSNIKPIFYQNREKIEKAREWAKHNARLANGRPGEAKKERRVRI
ncbi:MAG: hypothetical protein QXY99_07100 [Thermoproteota archaeon]